MIHLVSVHSTQNKLGIREFQCVKQAADVDFSFILSLSLCLNFEQIMTFSPDTQLQKNVVSDDKSD